MKKVVYLLLLLVLSSLKPALASDTTNLYLFWSATCPHCKRELAYLNKLNKQDENLKITLIEIGDRKNVDSFQKVAEKLGTNERGSVPYTIIGNESFIGFDTENDSGPYIESLIAKAKEEENPDVVAEFLTNANTVELKKNGTTNNKEDKQKRDLSGAMDKLNLPIFGEIDLKTVSLPLLTILIALVDGFNPCAMWVLLFLISILLGTNDKKKMWILGGSFILASGAVYYAFLAAWLNLFFITAYSSFIRYGIGVLAVGGGIYYLRDYYKNKDGGCEVVDEKKRNLFFDKIKNFVEEKNLFLAILGLVSIAVAVNLIELICTAGLPAIYTKVLSLSNLNPIKYYLYLLFYIIIFMLDDIIVFAIAMKTMDSVGISSKYARYSHLIGGILVLIIGLLLIFKPEILSFA